MDMAKREREQAKTAAFPERASLPVQPIRMNQRDDGDQEEILFPREQNLSLPGWKWRPYLSPDEFPGKGSKEQRRRRDGTRLWALMGQTSAEGGKGEGLCVGRDSHKKCATGYSGIFVRFLPPLTSSRLFSTPSCLRHHSCSCSLS